VKRTGVARVGQPLAGQLVGPLAALMETGPAKPFGHQEFGPGILGHPGRQAALAAVVINSNRVPAGNAAGGGGPGVDQHGRRPGRLPELRDFIKRRVEKKAVGRRDKLQCKPGAPLRVTDRLTVGKGVEPLPGPGPGEEFHLAGGGVEGFGIGVVRDIEGHGMPGPHPVRIDTGHEGRVVRQQPVDTLIFSQGEDRFPKPHPVGQILEDRQRRTAPANRRDDRFGQLDIIVAVCPVEILHLQKAGPREDNIGHAGRIRHEHLLDRNKQVLPGQAGHHLARLGGHRRRVGEVDMQVFDRRSVQFGQRVAQMDHVHPPGSGRTEIGAGQKRQIGRCAAQTAGDPGPGLLEGAHQCRQQGNRPHGHGPAELAARSPAGPDVGRIGTAIGPGQVPNRFGGKPADVGRLVRRVPGRACVEGIEPDGSRLDEGVVDQVVADQHVHHSQGQGGIGPRPDHQVGIGPLGRLGPIGVNDHQPGPVLPGLLEKRPGMQIGRQGVRPPDDDEIGGDGRRDGGRWSAPQAGFEPGAGGRTADGREQPAGSQLVEKRVARMAVDQAHVPGIKIGQNRLRPPIRRHRGGTLGNFAQGLVPANGHERPRAFGAVAFQRLQNPFGMVWTCSGKYPALRQMNPRVMG
jgi:hypothetical protein